MRILRVLPLASLLLASVLPAHAQQPGAFSSEAITVSTTAVGLAATTLRQNERQAGACSFTVETADIRVALDGSTPTAATAHAVSAGTPFNVVGNVSLRQLRMIREDGSDATVRVTCAEGATPPLDPSGGAAAGVGGSFNGVLLDAAGGDSLTDTANNALRVNVVAGGAAGGTSSNFGAAMPAAGTAAGMSDGTNMVPFLATTTQADGLANTLDGLNVTGFTYVFGGATWNRWTGEVNLGTTQATALDDIVTNTGLLAATNGYLSTLASNVSIDAVHGAAARDNGPQSVGYGSAVSALPTAVTAGQAVRQWYTLNGAAVSTSAGCTPNSFISAASVNETEIKPTPGVLRYLSVSSLDATPVYLKLYNDTAVNVDETDTPVWRWGLPANATAANGAASVNLMPPSGMLFSTAIVLRATTGIADNSTGALTASEVLVSYCYE